MTMKKVGIVMGSDSDLPVVEKAFDVCREYGVPFEAHEDKYSIDLAEGYIPTGKVGER